MNRSMKRILPVLLVLVIIFSVCWYLLVYDRAFTQDILLHSARFFEDRNQHRVAAWLYDQAYRQSNKDAQVAIELAERFKEAGNYTKAEYTLSNAIADGGSVELYVALCKTYVEQDKLLDAVRMLEKVSDPLIKAQLDDMRPANPIPDPAPGYYSQYISVSFKPTEGTLYVTTDKQYPSTHNQPFQAGISLQPGENTLYALVIGENGLVSELTVMGYVVGGVIEDITLSDRYIDEAVRALLRKSDDVVLSTADLWNITSFTMPKDAENYNDLQYLPYLESLSIDSGNFADLNGLASLSYLKELTIRNSDLSAADLATIASLPNLRKLTLENCSLSSIAALAGAKNITHLDLSNNAFRDLSALSEMTRLEVLNLSHNAVTELDQLSKLTNLRELNVSYNSITTVAALAGCSNLSTLNISYNSLVSLENIDSLKGLFALDASHNDLTDVTPLTGCPALTELDISHNSVANISALSALNNLVTFRFNYNKVTQLPQWEKDCNLVTIEGSHNQISSVKALGGLSQLNFVILEYNKLTNVDALAECHNMIRVDIFGNSVKDVSKLTDQSIIVNYSPV